MREKNYYKRIQDYYLKTALKTVVWEAKICQHKALPFSSLADHQEMYLIRASDRMSYKFPDVGIAKKPFDGLTIVRAVSYVIVIFFEAKGFNVYEIPIENWVDEKYTSQRKSLTQDRAKIIGKQIMI